MNYREFTDCLCPLTKANIRAEFVAQTRDIEELNLSFDTDGNYSDPVTAEKFKVWMTERGSDVTATALLSNKILQDKLEERRRIGERAARNVRHIFGIVGKL